VTEGRPRVAGQCACGRITGLNRAAFGAHSLDDRAGPLDREPRMPEMQKDRHRQAFASPDKADAIRVRQGLYFDIRHVTHLRYSRRSAFRTCSRTSAKVRKRKVMPFYFKDRALTMARRFLRWFFQNRETDAITIAQAPNLVLWIVIAGGALN
jgi:hypothetical protein